MWIFFRGRVKKLLCPHNTDCMLLCSASSLAVMCTCHIIILLTFPFSEPTSVNISYRTTKIIEIIFQKHHWHEKSFPPPKKGHFAHIGNEIKICGQNKCHHHLSNVCENSFRMFHSNWVISDYHLFVWQFEFPWLNLTNCPNK